MKQKVKAIQKDNIGHFDNRVVNQFSVEADELIDLVWQQSGFIFLIKL